jgi:protein transport protein SEC39
MLRRDVGGSKLKPGASETSAAVTCDQPRIRKRDPLRNAAVGSLASGIGWLINAPPTNDMDNDDENQ